MRHELLSVSGDLWRSIMDMTRPFRDGRRLSTTFRGHILASIVLANLCISLAILIALLSIQNWSAVVVMVLHLIYLAFTLRWLMLLDDKKPDATAFCYLNLITWPLLQELMGGISGSGGIMVWMFMAPLSASFMSDRRVATRIFIICLTMQVLAVLWEPHSFLWRKGQIEFSPMLFLMNVLGVSMICYVSISSFLEHIRILRKKMMAQSEDIQGSIHYAKNIQCANLPSSGNLTKALGEHLLFYLPKDIVSGDFYWTAEKDGYTIVAVADCTGHGVPGGFMTMLGINSLNNIVLEKGVTDPALILHYLHWCIREPFTRSETQINDGMDISICAINKEDRTILFSGAMSLMYHVNGTLHTYTSPRTSVGEPTMELPFDNQLISYSPGDMFYLCTDGLSDQFGGPSDKRYGRKRLRELMLRISRENLVAQKEIVEQEFRTWKGDRDQIDDILMLGFSIN